MFVDHGTVVGIVIGLAAGVTGVIVTLKVAGSVMFERLFQEPRVSRPPVSIRPEAIEGPVDSEAETKPGA